MWILAFLSCRTPVDPSTSVTEIPYDGIDQDGDGEDLVDVDGDGFAGVEAGGDDCDDADATVAPGASEIPYDGIDQDCDGEDLSDVDGDGHAATQVGGDDCDDDDASVSPDVDEEPGNLVNDDCDTWVDEVEVCADGSAAYVAVQEGIDACPDGGVVEVCTGTYVESLLVDDKRFTIAGAGPTPDDVVIEAPDGERLLLMDGEQTDLAIERVWLRATGYEATGWTYEAINGEAHAVRLSGVRLRAIEDGDVLAVFFTAVGPDASVVIQDSWIDGAWVGVGFEYGALTLTRSVVDGQLILGAGSEFNDSNPDWSDSYSEMTVRNVLGIGQVELWGGYNYSTTFEVSNSTFADDDSGSYLLGTTCEYSCPATTLRNVVIAGRTGPVWRVVGDSQEQPRYYFTIDATMGWDLPDGWTDGPGAYIRDNIVLADPAFAYDTGLGSYALGFGSPALDAGIGTDADGSTADLGAFGGPESDWWREFEWALP